MSLALLAQRWLMSKDGVTDIEARWCTEIQLTETIGLPIWTDRHERLLSLAGSACRNARG